jgi:hypothetical protein
MDTLSEENRVRHEVVIKKLEERREFLRIQKEEDKKRRIAHGLDFLN